MDIYSLLVLGHIVGTVLGVGAATFVEIHIIHALHEGKSDPDETLIMQITYNMLRIGLVLLVLSGMGFLIYDRIMGFPGLIHSAQFWVKLGVVGVLVLSAMAQQLKLLPRAWTSAIAIASWYTALTLGVLHEAAFPVVETILAYVLVVVLLYQLFSFLHRRYSKVLHSNH